MCKRHLAFIMKDRVLSDGVMPSYFIKMIHCKMTILGIVWRMDWKAEGLEAVQQVYNLLENQRRDDGGLSQRRSIRMDERKLA